MTRTLPALLAIALIAATLTPATTPARAEVLEDTVNLLCDQFELLTAMDLGGVDPVPICPYPDGPLVDPDLGTPVATLVGLVDFLIEFFEEDFIDFLCPGDGCVEDGGDGLFEGTCVEDGLVDGWTLAECGLSPPTDPVGYVCLLVASAVDSSSPGECIDPDLIAGLIDLITGVCGGDPSPTGCTLVDAMICEDLGGTGESSAAVCPGIPPLGGIPTVPPGALTYLTSAVGTVADCAASLTGGPMGDCPVGAPADLVSLGDLAGVVPDDAGPTCPSTGFDAPTAGSYGDDDGDGVGAITLHWTHYTLTPGCTWTTTSTGTDALGAPDADDDDPCSPVPCGIAAGCPGLGPATLYGAPTVEDRDGDGQSAVYLHTTTYYLTSFCALASGDGGESRVDFPDPDDDEASADGTCGPADGFGFTLPAGLVVGDADSDGIPDLGYGTTTYTATASCGLTTDPGDTTWLGEIPAAPIPGVPAFCPESDPDCELYADTFPGMCGYADDDYDNVPVVYACDSTVTCYGDLHCATTSGPITDSTGDPDDHDPCKPIAMPGRNACLDGTNPDNRTAGDRDDAGNKFQLEQQARYWTQKITNTQFPWWILVVGLLLILWYYKREKNRPMRRRA